MPAARAGHHHSPEIIMPAPKSKSEQFDKDKIDDATDLLYAIEQTIAERFRHADRWGESHLEELRNASAKLTDARLVLSSLRRL